MRRRYEVWQHSLNPDPAEAAPEVDVTDTLTLTAHAWAFHASLIRLCIAQLAPDTAQPDATRSLRPGDDNEALLAQMQRSMAAGW